MELAPRYRLELAGIWSVVAMVLLFLAGFAVGYIPPPRPGADAAAIGEFYSGSPELRRFGALLFALGALLFLPFGAAVSAQMRRIEDIGPTAAAVQFGCAVILAMLTIFCSMMMMVAAFRVDRSPELVQAINDMAWLPFVAVFMPGAVEALVVAAAIFSDRAATPVLPRWVAWFSVWMAFTELTGAMVGFFHTGPFGWNGLAAFYLGGAVFLAWYLVIFAVVRRAILQQAKEGT